MLTISGRQQRNSCDGVSRRSFLRIGELAIGGLTLSQLLQAEAQTGGRRSDPAIIMVYLPDEPSHLDLYDPKTAALSAMRS